MLKVDSSMSETLRFLTDPGIFRNGISAVNYQPLKDAKPDPPMSWTTTNRDELYGVINIGGEVGGGIENML